MDLDPLPNSLVSQIITLSATFSTPQIVALACALCALLLSGFASGCEIAFFSINPDDERLDDTPRGEAVKQLLSQPERLLATILITNNLVNVTIVVLTNFALGPVFTGMSPVLSFVMQTILLTFLILLFGEIFPKLYCRRDPIGWATMAAPGLKIFWKLFYPLSSMLVKSTTIVNRVVTKRADNITTDELSQALDITDVSSTPEKEMLQEILRFGDTTAAEVMTPRVDVTGVELSSTFSEVMEVVLESGYARLPVYDDSLDNISGILYSRDLLPYIGTEQDSKADNAESAASSANAFDWRQLIRKPYFVPGSRGIDDLFEDFRKMKIHLAVVIDEFGGTQGIVTLEDVLEEIVGDINDEYDEEDTTYKRLPDDTYIFEGRTLLNDFFRVTAQDPEEYEDVTEDCETLAGMLLAIKGDFPKEKEPLVYGHCRFLILDIEHHRITRVRVKVMEEMQS